MKYADKFVRIGDTEFSPDDLKALRTWRDWQILREASGFKSVGFWDGISGPDNAEQNTTQIQTKCFNL